MNYGVIVALALGFAMIMPGRGDAEMQCEDFDTGEALCDDGTQMYYRAEPAAPFVLLDEETRLKVLAYLAGRADAGAAVPSNDEPDANTTFYGSSGSITSGGDCVSLSAPGVSFMGSGC